MERTWAQELMNRTEEAICMLDALSRTEWKLRERDRTQIVLGLRGVKRALNSVRDDYFEKPSMMEPEALAAFDFSDWRDDARGDDAVSNCFQCAALLKGLRLMGEYAEGYDAGGIVCYALEGLDRLVTELAQMAERQRDQAHADTLRVAASFPVPCSCDDDQRPMMKVALDAMPVA